MNEVLSFICNKGCTIALINKSHLMLLATHLDKFFNACKYLEKNSKYNKCFSLIINVTLYY